MSTQGVEKVVNRIEENSKEEAEEIISDAKEEAEEILDEARKKAETEKQEIIEKGKEKADREKNRMISEAKLENRRKILETKEEIISEIFEETLRRLEEGEVDKRDILGRIVKSAGIELGGGSLTVSSKEDELDLIKDMKNNLEDQITEKTGNKTSIALDEPIEDGGVIVRDPEDQTKINKTYRKIIDRRRNDLRQKLDEILFS
ncbi:MAG: Archaeal/vacuolar-type H+-ATPase subunit E [Candidatus Methanohalarchaeum thermophilum]|uniref:A-type ATP synthase subunit E n=1 Tax=Methanohalarchaeum thermophilum TaxID=1903181 RepID=A0A1Q6DUT5_METT1|nr:MAG: Archaeal/vacuolar-type H+-ATPase subunit E [Candidatus Methanohalarchaeum thermophilum]